MSRGKTVISKDGKRAEGNFRLNGTSIFGVREKVKIKSKYNHRKGKLEMVATDSEGIKIGSLEIVKTPKPAESGYFTRENVDSSAGAYYPFDAKIETWAQNQGLGTYMYDIASSQLAKRGNYIVPSPMQSEKAEGLWKRQGGKWNDGLAVYNRRLSTRNRSRPYRKSAYTTDNVVPLKKADNNKRYMTARKTWRTPAPTRSIDKVQWDRWDRPGEGSNVQPMTKSQANRVAQNIRTKKAGGGVHLARVIPVSGGYVVYERPKSRKWDSNRLVRRMKSDPNARGGNLYLRRVASGEDIRIKGKKLGVWGERFADLKIEGLTHKQLDAVDRQFDSARCFGSQRVADSASEQLAMVKSTSKEDLIRMREMQRIAIQNRIERQRRERAIRLENANREVAMRRRQEM